MAPSPSSLRLLLVAAAASLFAADAFSFCAPLRPRALQYVRLEVACVCLACSLVIILTSFLSVMFAGQGARPAAVHGLAGSAVTAAAAAPAPVEGEQPPHGFLCSG